jgi:UDP-glucose 4-epimerase
MNIISGSQGFIGSHLYDAVINPLGIDKRDTKRQQNWIPVDLLSKNELFWVLRDHKIEYVYHLAAVPSVPDSYANPMATYLNNVNASLNLIDVCKKLDVKKMIFASSSSVKGTSPYGHSKKIIEEALQNCGLQFTTLRFFNVFGPRQRSNVVKIMYDKIKANEEVVIFGDGKTTRDFTYVDNVVKACLKATHHQYNGETLEVGTGEPHTLLDLYEAIRSRVNPKHNKLSFKPDRIGDIRFSKARTFLDNSEIINFEQGIDKWLRLESSAQVLLGERLQSGSQNLPLMW